MDDIIRKEYKDFNNKENKKLQVEVYYDLGGYSYLSGTKNPRGYYLSVTPVLVKEHSVEYSFNDRGYKTLLLEVKRKRKKRADEAIKLSYEKEQELIDAVLQRYNIN